jgi:diaminohydroxyphosphoribosylaminopyrimidine deaminase/5-amino-6-(5-phosphoribosylamino)uracil reductase
MDSLSLFNDDWVGNTCLIAREAALQQHPEALRRLDEKGICLWLLPDKRDGGIDLSTLVPRMRAEGLDSLYIEGGGRTLSSFLNAGLIDYLIAVVCPKILGDVEAVAAFGGRAPETIDQALRIREPVFTILGDDCRIEGFLDYRRAER